MLPPDAVPASAPLTEFSSGRAMEYLNAIAQKPHPTGSPENARVRDYILSRLTALGLSQDVQTTTVVGPRMKRLRPVAAVTVTNVLARLKGTNSSKAVMLAAHYDSVPTGPGASDDGSGTVTLLETARALKAGPPLRNDVIFLFTDGEELGLLGAKAFVDEHPWAKEVGLVLNFEARGACGPSMMFESSSQNSWLIREFAKAAPHPVASSLMYEGYRRLPNDTDLTILKRAGLAGLNFAYAGCWPRYHTAGDSVEEIDERSLQHHGANALALARHFGNLSLNNTMGRDAVYFSLFGRMLYYSQAWAIPLMALVLLAFVGVVALGLKKSQLHRRGIALGFLGWPAGTVVALAISEILWLALRKSRFVSLLPYGMAYNSEIYMLGFVALAIAIISALYAVLQKKTSVGNLAVGALFWWLLLTILTSLSVPGASFLFVWPLLFSLIELGYAFARRKPESEVESALVWTLPAIVGILLVVPAIYQLFILVSTSGLVPITVAVALLLGFLVPHLHIMTAHNRWLLPGGAALAAVVLIIAAMSRSGFDSKHPRADSIFYALNVDTGTAVWVSSDKAPDAWTSQFFSGQVESTRLTNWIPVQVPVLQTHAPVAQLAAPKASVLDDITLGDSRILRLWITSPRQARIAWIIAPSAKVTEASVNGKPIPPSDANSHGGNWGFYYAGLPEKGIILGLSVKPSQPLELKIVDQSDGLPDIPGVSFKPRPHDLMPAPWPPFDSSTLVSKSFRFDPNAPMKHP